MLKLLKRLPKMVAAVDTIYKNQQDIEDWGASLVVKLSNQRRSLEHHGDVVEQLQGEVALLDNTVSGLMDQLTAAAEAHVTLVSRLTEQRQRTTQLIARVETLEKQHVHN